MQQKSNFNPNSIYIPFILTVGLWVSFLLQTSGVIEKCHGVIPRNHKVEEALSAAENNNFNVMNKLLSVLKNPYDTKDISEYQSPAPLTKEKYKTFCGT